MMTTLTPEPTIAQIRSLRANPVTIQRIVTRPKGSWKWQDAFAISTYALRLSADEKSFIWKLTRQTAKLSRPQLGDAWGELTHGRPTVADIPA